MPRIVFKRKIYSELVLWKEKSAGRSALLIEGARRVGKTTIAMEFAKNEYKSFLSIDFMNPLPGTEEVFKAYRHDIGLLTSNLALLYGVTLHQRDSLIIFDEVQNYPKARELIKYLVKDGRYDYIETGSLISIKNNVKDIQIPSEERVIQMAPMDFEEWLWANGDMDTMPAIVEHFEKREPFGQTMHRVMTDKYRQYMQVGGMPGAVSTFLENHDMVETENAKRDILALYRRDMRKNSDPDATQLIFDNLPELLSSHCKVFSPGALVRGSVTSDYSKALDWLFESKILNRCVSNTDPNAAMNMGNRSIRFKEYLLDTGLLITLALDVGTLDRTVVVEFAKSNLGINEGMLLENMVAQELASSGHKLFFSEFYDKEDDKHLYEVDFIMVKDGKIVPIEVKSSYSGRHASLDRFREKYRKRLGQPFVIHQKDLRVGEDGIIYIPVYMASLL